MINFSNIDNLKKFKTYNILLKPINKLDDEFNYDILFHYNETTDYSSIYVDNINITSKYDIPYENEKEIYHYIRSILRVKDVFLKNRLKDTKFLKKQINEWTELFSDKNEFFENYKCVEWRSKDLKEQHKKLLK